MISYALLSNLEATRQRYEQREAERERYGRVLADQGVLRADTPARVSRRLERLNADWSLAEALDRTPAHTTTGRSLDQALAPESFGADVLGLERLMGRNDLVDVGFLEAGHLASRSVGRVTVSGHDAHYGTGFMVSPRLLMTNNHVLRDAAEAARGHVEFNFQAGIDGRALAPVAFALDPSSFFATALDLDFTVVAAEARNPDGWELASFGALPLLEQEGKVLIGELVNIIQHPNGEPKQLALRENRVVDLLDVFLHYETDTAPGSSGSPVFNDQWEVVGLHHSGVPKTDDEGRFLALDGSMWTPDMGEHRLAWKANEGVRISRVLRRLREEPLTGEAAELRAQLSEALGAPVPPAGSPAPAVRSSAPSPGVSGPGVLARWTLPLQIGVTVEAPQGMAPSAAAPADRSVLDPRAGSVGSDRAEDDELRAALVNLETGRARDYYDERTDREARERYYDGVETSGGAALRVSLAELLERTHEREPRYQPMRLVYPWVDVHPDGLLRSVYSGKTFPPEDLIRADAAVEGLRTERWQELVRRETALAPDALEAEFDTLERSLPYNCEHVVPQSWFAKAEPMRGDLHHLFACESGCNSFRGNFPYFDFADAEEALRHACGRREDEGFEPAAGKGPVARATLYFLLRYPGLIGDAVRELAPERLDLLLAWHEGDPVGEYERHRNLAIAELQGNRNPLIDHGDWARRIDFAGAWGMSGAP